MKLGYKKIRALFAGLLVIVMSLFLNGCASSDVNVYMDVQDQMLRDMSEGMSTPDVKKHGGEMLYDFCISMKQYAPFVMVGSFIFGVIIFRLFRKEKKIQKHALFTFMLGIPALMFISTYFVCFLYGCFNF